MIKRIMKCIKESEQGASMVEFALVAILLLTLIFGIIEFGWIFNGYITLKSAAQEGARLAIVMDIIDESAVKDKVKEHAKIFKSEELEIQITSAGVGEEMKVSVIGELDLLIALPPFPSTINMQTTATMRQER